MTYCLAIKVEEGLVFASDSRTNAGLDNIGSYTKCLPIILEIELSLF